MTPSSILSTAADTLGFTADERATFAALEDAAQGRHPVEYGQLLELANDPEIRRRHAELRLQQPALIKEEMAWLAATIRRAVEESPDAAWAVLFLTLAWRMVLTRKVEHRLNPAATRVTPSAFVYAMQ